MSTTTRDLWTRECLDSVRNQVPLSAHELSRSIKIPLKDWPARRLSVALALKEYEPALHGSKLIHGRWLGSTDIEFGLVHHNWLQVENSPYSNTCECGHSFDEHAFNDMFIDYVSENALEVDDRLIDEFPPEDVYVSWRGEYCERPACSLCACDEYQKQHPVKLIVDPTRWVLDNNIPSISVNRYDGNYGTIYSNARKASPEPVFTDIHEGPFSEFSTIDVGDDDVIKVLSEASCTALGPKIEKKMLGPGTGPGVTVVKKCHLMLLANMHPARFGHAAPLLYKALLKADLGAWVPIDYMEVVLGKEKAA